MNKKAHDTLANQLEKFQEEKQKKLNAQHMRDNPPEDCGPELVKRMRRILNL